MKEIIITFLFTGQSMHEDKNSRRLLLLRLWTSRVATESRLQLRQYGPAND